MNSSINAEFRRDMNKDPSELEREIDVTRANLESTLEALEHRLSPSDMLGQLWSQMRTHGGEFGENLGHQVKQHPMPALLTTIGLAWMMASNGQRYDGNGSTHSSHRMGSGAGDRLRSTGARMKASGSRVKESGARMKDKLHRAGDALQRRREGVREGVVGARERVEGSTHALGSRARAMSESARHRAHRAGSGFNHLLEDQPLLLGAIGLAAGVIAGAAMPPTEREDRALGPVRDRAMDRARAAGAEGAQRAREQVEQVAEKARHAMEEHGGNGHHPTSESSGTAAPPAGSSTPSMGSTSPGSSSDPNRTSSPGTGLGY